VEYVRIGGTGLQVSRIGFGCAAMGGYDYGSADDAESVEAVRAAIEAGITLFDVADVYGLGRAEEVLGRALREAGDPAVVLATKGGVRWDEQGRTKRDSSVAWLSRALDDSLRRLGVERIGLYQLHWPDPLVPVEDTLGFLEQRRDEGKIAEIGCCNFSPTEVDRAQRRTRVESLQLPLSLAEPTSAVDLRACRTSHGMLTMTYNSLAHGLFAGKLGRRSTFDGTDLRRRSPLFQSPYLETNLDTLERLRIVGARRGRSCSEVALRWVLDQPGVDVALAGIRTAAHARENSRASDWTLAADDLAFLASPTPNSPFE
jgi:aryl-alcohol dehydrogenase-like predicted oxidoreductase